jgi:transcriptional regulator with XRE-family HTH domain
MTIGEKIKNLRNLCQLTQEELADRCELTKGYISQVENDLTSPTISTLSDILTALGTNLSEFFLEESSSKLFKIASQSRMSVSLPLTFKCFIISLFLRDILRAEVITYIPPAINTKST